ncbi:type III secretion system chaperone [Ramlibacter sp. AW1]|uniref:Type III secretion system chaperone n=1 Tax=Ramlibacter aurantiacus TaxID=2801330 RepID=A0A936ZFT6_9BURK|nr:type III secretion system chaperone [Ramlibacter aurantiacus]MBL0420132.1 type III secretion system chaperone [Ramlibacter aurantiacus]
MFQPSPSEEQARVNAWLRSLGAKTGLTLQLDDSGLCAVGHDCGLDCAIEVPDGHGMVYLRVPVLPWPSGGQPHVLAEHCLEASFLGMQTGGACFAVDRQDAELVLWTSRPLTALDENSFLAWVLALLETAAEWKQKLDEVYRTADVHLQETEALDKGFA